MQREEEITPGVWPPGYVCGARSAPPGVQKASSPSSASTSPSSSASSSAAATPVATRPSSNTRNTNAPPAATSDNGRFNMARRVMSENLDSGSSRSYTISASTSGRGSSSNGDGAPLPQMAANNAIIRSQAHNPLTNRLARSNLATQVQLVLRRLFFF